MDNQGALIYYPDSQVNFIRRAVRARGNRGGEQGTVVHFCCITVQECRSNMLPGDVVQLSEVVKQLIIWMHAKVHEKMVTFQCDSVTTNKAW